MRARYIDSVHPLALFAKLGGATAWGQRDLLMGSLNMRCMPQVPGVVMVCVPGGFFQTEEDAAIG